MNGDPALATITERLTEARDALHGEHMNVPASEIFARDRRRRGRLGLAAAGSACAAAGLAVALTAATGGPARAPDGSVAPRPAQLAAWTVQSNPDGSVTFTLNNTSHPAKLQRTLARVGVRAVVRWGEICMAGGPGQPLLDTGGFMKNDTPLEGGVGSYMAVQGQGTGGPNPDLGWSETVFPRKMPPGGQFVISAMSHSVPGADIQAAWEFAKTSAPIACTKQLLKPGQEP